MPAPGCTADCIVGIVDSGSGSGSGIEDIDCNPVGPDHIVRTGFADILAADSRHTVVDSHCIAGTVDQA